MSMAEEAPGRSAGGSVVAQKPFGPGLPFYTVADDCLEMGASFGNGAVWVNTKGSGAVERIFELRSGQRLVDAITIRYAGPGHRYAEHDPETAAQQAESYVGLLQDGPGTFEIHPAYQRHRFRIAAAVEVVETLFLPLAPGGTAGGDPPLVYQVVELQNTGPYQQNVRIQAHARLRGTLGDDVTARYDPELHALVAHNAGQPEMVRVFGVGVAPSGHATSFDYAAAYDILHVRPLPDSESARGDILGSLQVDLELAPGEGGRCAFRTAVASAGEAAAIAAYRAGADDAAVLEGTVAHIDELISRGQVLTPDPQINQGALWSKVNMHRVMGHYPQGHSFTNEPGVSSNVVGRDAAWFVYGNDHFLPQFSRALLDTFAAKQYPSGKIPEYYSALDGHVEDYGLNINDDTPLFILAVNHHWRAAGDRAWLEGIYPAVAKAARYIVAQEDARGLVCCTAQDPRGNVWAIASWRNVIPLYSINGAVTEINAECAAALRGAGHLAANLGRPQAEAQEFFDAADRLRAAMSAHLLNPENGLYYLNIDLGGNAHTDVTGDEIFPVMFRVCDEDVGFRIISRLNAPDFWTDAGLRTASRADPMYDPITNVGLLGGVWPGLTWWYAFAAARYHPEFMVKALRASFEHYAADPKPNNTVPGQFSEWFDGESLINRGMRLSPWEPPRFLWAAVEGVCGLMLTTGAPSVNPLVPRTWKWVALRRLPYHGGELTYFAARYDEKFHIYATADVETGHEATRYDEDVSDRVHAASASAEVVALRRPGELLVLVGNVGAQTSVVPLDLHQLLDAQAAYRVRIYNSERGVWERGHREPGSVARALAVVIEEGGFRAIELKGE